MLRGKIITTKAYIKIEGSSQINYLNLHLKELEKINLKLSKEIIKIRAEISDIDNRKEF